MKNLKKVGKALSKVEQKEINGGGLSTRCIRRNSICSITLRDFLMDGDKIVGCCALSITLDSPAG